MDFGVVALLQQLEGWQVAGQAPGGHLGTKGQASGILVWT